jgi:nucleoside-diphosphate-sugar epimerase
MRVLVTGGSGKAGAYVVRELAGAGHEVWNIDVGRPPADGLPGRFIKVDLRDAGAVYDAFAQARPEGVCHVAANPAPGGDPRQEVFANNVLSTYHVLQAAGDFGLVRRFVYASSEMATGWLTTDRLPERFPFAEEDRVTTPNAYALSKYLGEVIADAMAVRYPEMALVSLRINNVITPETYHWLAERRAGYPHGGSANFWSYIDVRDVATAFRAALEGESVGHEVFLIAAADTCLDVPFRQALTDRFGPDAAARVAEGHGEHQSAFDCGKIARVFGWRAQHSWRDQPAVNGGDAP